MAAAGPYAGVQPGLPGDERCALGEGCPFLVGVVPYRPPPSQRPPAKHGRIGDVG